MVQNLAQVESLRWLTMQAGADQLAALCAERQDPIRFKKSFSVYYPA